MPHCGFAARCCTCRLPRTAWLYSFFATRVRLGLVFGSTRTLHLPVLGLRFAHTAAPFGSFARTVCLRSRLRSPHTHLYLPVHTTTRTFVLVLRLQFSLPSYIPVYWLQLPRLYRSARFTHGLQPLPFTFTVLPAGCVYATAFLPRSVYPSPTGCATGYHTTLPRLRFGLRAVSASSGSLPFRISFTAATPATPFCTHTHCCATAVAAAALHCAGLVRRSLHAHRTCAATAVILTWFGFWITVGWFLIHVCRFAVHALHNGSHAAHWFAARTVSRLLPVGYYCWSAIVRLRRACRKHRIHLLHGCYVLPVCVYYFPTPRSRVRAHTRRFGSRYARRALPVPAAFCRGLRVLLYHATAACLCTTRLVCSGLRSCVTGLVGYIYAFCRSFTLPSLPHHTPPHVLHVLPVYHRIWFAYAGYGLRFTCGYIFAVYHTTYRLLPPGLPRAHITPARFRGWFYVDFGSTLPPAVLLPGCCYLPHYWFLPVLRLRYTYLYTFAFTCPFPTHVPGCRSWLHCHHAPRTRCDAPLFFHLHRAL